MMTIILIGPICAGKSTLAQLLAEHLNLERLELDDRRWGYYAEIGYDEQRAKALAESDEGMLALLRYWKPFEAHAVERIVSDCAGSVIDFGAGHSVYEDGGLFERVKRALEPFRNVVLLLPSKDLDRSIEILSARLKAMFEEKGWELDEGLLAVNEHFVKHPSNQILATMTVFTEGKSAEETCAEIVARLR